MWEYNLVYVIVWCIGLFSQVSGLTRFGRDFLFFLQFLVLSLFSAFRFETGYDWPVYQSYFVAYDKESFHLVFEPGYNVLQQFFLISGLNFNHFLFFVSFIGVFLIAITVKKMFPRYACLILAVFYSIPDFYLIPVFSLLRQNLSIAFFCIGVYFFYRNKSLSLALFVLSISFHYSSVFSILVFYILVLLPIKKSTSLIAFFVSALLYAFSIDVVRLSLEVLLGLGPAKYLSYLERDVYNASVMYRFSFIIVSAVSYFLLYKSTKKGVEIFGVKAYSVIFSISVFSLLMPLVFFGFPTISTRYQYFFAVFFVGLCFLYLERFEYRSRLFVIFVLAIFFYIPFYRFLSSSLSVVYIPYQSQLFYDEYNSTGELRTRELIDELNNLWGVEK